tara:strand:- start:1333 stop:2043 length:711 start_codon:yes stop_codon:yes gene_type:complete
MDTGDKISTKKSNFSFGGKTPKYFDQHVKKSVPLYDVGQDIICKLSSFFISKNCNIYDLGCSTGTLIKKIDEYNSLKTMNFYGIDVEKNMIDLAKKKLKTCKNKINLKCADINKVKFKKSELIVSYYTIQFLKPKYRQALINKIYNSLNWGGAFIYFEKVRASDARFQDLMNQIYLEYKHDIGYNEKQVWNKSLSLRGVLEPYSTNENMNFLKRAGFKDYMSILKYSCFEGFLAIK